MQAGGQGFESPSLHHRFLLSAFPLYFRYSCCPFGMIATILLVIHVAAGSVALLTAFVALVTAKGGVIHVRAGRAYAIGMTLIFLTAVPLAVLGADVFLLLIAFFSMYLVFAGWRFARNRSRRPQPVDWIAVAIMGITGLAMWGYAVVLVLSGSGQWVTMLAFGAIAVALSVADGLFFRAGMNTQRRPAPYLRIQRHLTNMMAGSIATVTAVMVVNVSMNPVWLPWLLPTIVITPLIVWWNVRTARQARPSTGSA